MRELHVSARSHVHLAVDDATGDQVALKTPAVDRQTDADFLDRFLLDEWVARRIDSPHVVRAPALQRARAPVRCVGVRAGPDPGAMDGGPPTS